MEKKISTKKIKTMAMKHCSIFTVDKDIYRVPSKFLIEGKTWQALFSRCYPIATHLSRVCLFLWLIFPPLSYRSKSPRLKHNWTANVKGAVDSIKRGICSVFDTNSFKKILPVENVVLPAQRKENRCKFYSLYIYI